MVPVPGRDPRGPAVSGTAPPGITCATAVRAATRHHQTIVITLNDMCGAIARRRAWRPRAVIPRRCRVAHRGGTITMFKRWRLHFPALGPWPGIPFPHRSSLCVPSFQPSTGHDSSKPSLASSLSRYPTTSGVQTRRTSRLRRPWHPQGQKKSCVRHHPRGVPLAFIRTSHRRCCPK